MSESSTVPLADCEPGAELQVDWAKVGFIVDRESGRRRTVWASLFTSVFSRHCFVWLSHSHALDAVISGFDAAWACFGGVFKVVTANPGYTVHLTDPVVADVMSQSQVCSLTLPVGHGNGPSVCALPPARRGVMLIPCLSW